MSEINLQEFSFENPPPVKNYPLYFWHIFVKVLSFTLFGIGTIFISIIAFPVMKILFWKEEKFRKAGHHFISFTFRFFVWFMSVLQAFRLTVDDKKKFRSLKSSVIVANHPSLLDVVMLISLIPDADCIVNASLAGKNIVHVIVSKLYIPNSLPHDELMKKCLESLKSGSCLIIFPEGTRSLPKGQNKYKKGAARVSLTSECPITPVYIGGNDKRGLRKHDSMFKFNTRERYIYNLRLHEPIFPQEYKDIPYPAASKKITERLSKILSDANNADLFKQYR